MDQNRASNFLSCILGHLVASSMTICIIETHMDKP